MRIRRPTSTLDILPYALALVLVFASAGCRTGAKLPPKTSAEFNQAVSAFYVGLAALQVGDDVRADSRLTQLTQLVPDEPAGWANWGLLALRQRNFDAAARDLSERENFRRTMIRSIPHRTLESAGGVRPKPLRHCEKQ